MKCGHSSSALLSARSPSKALAGDCARNSIVGASRAFATGFAVKAAIDLLPLVFKGKLFKLPLKKVASRPFTADTFQFAASLAGLVGVYKAALCVLRRLNPESLNVHSKHSITISNGKGDGYENGHVNGNGTVVISPALKLERINGYIVGSEDDDVVDYSNDVILPPLSPSPEQYEPFPALTSAAVNSFIAGCLAGAAVVLIDKNVSRRRALSLFILTRAGQYGLYWLLKEYRALQVRKREASSSPNSSHESTGEMIARFLEQHGGSLAFIVGCVQVIYGVVLDQSILPASYLRFVAKYARISDDYGKDNVTFLRTISDFAANSGIMNNSNPADIMIPKGITSREAVAAHPLLQHLTQYMPVGIHHDYLGCALEHPRTTSCFEGNAKRWLSTLPGIFKLYGTINLIILLVGYKRAMKNPLQSAGKWFVSSARSTTLLASIATGCFAVLCASRRTIGYDAFPAYLLNGFVGGLFIFVEAPSRRTELGMYMLLRAIESQWDLGIKKGWWRAVKGGQLVYSALSVGVLMSLYQHDPSSIRSGYLSVMTRLFGHN
ncbi:hypothetical protein GQ42DRAFT_160425 [Ramicandelaber brevisporus]|nr:hypothetical protein GQ42DRAFT_160425 [Ramicandelaber brevisporus]